MGQGVGGQPKGVPPLLVWMLFSVTVPMFHAAIWVLLKAPWTMIDLSEPLSATKSEGAAGRDVRVGFTFTKISLFVAAPAVTDVIEFVTRIAEPLSDPTLK